MKCFPCHPSTKCQPYTVGFLQNKENLSLARRSPLLMYLPTVQFRKKEKPNGADVFVFYRFYPSSPQPRRQCLTINCPLSTLSLN